jgi:hypothetical protein
MAQPQPVRRRRVDVKWQRGLRRAGRLEP